MLMFNEILLSVLSALQWPFLKIPAENPPTLVQGLYQGSGSRQIIIATQGDRVCFQGNSQRGIVTASIHPINGLNGNYFVYYINTSLRQKDTKTILFGELEYNFKSSLEANHYLDQCLTSDTPFFQSFR